MPYRQATKDDVWVDDVNAPDYNSWQKRGETKASSFEEMRRNDHYYRLGAVIGYNRQPAVKGHGSAIFLHVWRGDGKPTSGCVAIDEQELAGIIGWLDPAKRPMILMGIRSDLLNGSEKRPSLEK
jgi:L,D-peptidoglycan transpeptidase YkuD (ErfK/YbiS/YcfS/YnhG family)